MVQFTSAHRYKNRDGIITRTNTIPRRAPNARAMLTFWTDIEYNTWMIKPYQLWRKLVKNAINLQAWSLVKTERHNRQTQCAIKQKLT